MQPFQVDQFVSFYEQLNALPTISVRLLGGSPEKAAELVRYTNIEKQYGVVYWSIGNEPTLYESQEQIPYDTVLFNQEWRAIAEAMKAVDPTIQLMGPELHQWGVDLASTPKDSSGRDWMTEFLRANGDLVDVVTVHRYPLYKPAGQVVTLDDLRNNTAEWPHLITYLRSLIYETTGRDLPIAITEVNSSPTSAFGGTATPDTIYNAIWYADVLGRLIQQHVFMVNQWVVSQRSGGLGLIHGSDVRPSLYVFYLYRNFGSQQVYASSDVASVTVYAARRPDGTLTILVINMADVAQQVPLQVEGGTPAEAEVWLLDATHNAENLGQQAIPASGTLSLPAQSATLYVIAP
jgi:alpha-L-arabinofuranosidase